MCLKQKIVCVECSNIAVMYTARGGCGCHYSCMHGWLARKGGVHDAPPTYIVAQFTEELVKLCSSLHTVKKDINLFMHELMGFVYKCLGGVFGNTSQALENAVCCLTHLCVWQHSRVT